ncbi:MAG TPA: alpha/beta hydrolase [Vicinamibacterales bacterium]|jgi:pimeloyl-ACP methyl ester carboxylesterase
MPTTTTPAPDRSGHLDVDGCRIHWERFGTGRRETVCLLNGLAMHTRAWSSFLPRLMPEFDIVLFDYPGQGQSSAEDAPCAIPRLGDYLAMILDHLGIDRLHLMGISYGGFVALEFARRNQHRLHTLTISGTLLSHETLFQMYQDLSLRFYRGSLELFEVYTHYLYEKIFGESFATESYAALEPMRQRFYDRYKDARHSLIRLTEAQIPLFADLDLRLPEYAAIRTPTLIMAGAEDRAIPVQVQQKIGRILPHTRFEIVDRCGHCVHLERSDVFFGQLAAFARAHTLEFEIVGTEGEA